MNNKFHKYCSIMLGVASLLLTASCIDPFKPALDKADTEYILVVEGLITNEPGSFVVKLSRSVPIDTLASSMPETGAHIIIEDDQNNSYEFEERTPGNYFCLNANARAEVGQTYQLRIVDSEGKEYESSPVKMLDSPELDKLWWKEVTNQVFSDNRVESFKGIDIYIDIDDPDNQTSYYKWDISETWEVVMPNKITLYTPRGEPVEIFVMVPEEKKYCWVTKELQNILVKSVDNQLDSRVENYLVKHLESYEDKLHFRYSIEVKQYRVNQFMYEYWSKLKEFNQDAGTLYDKVPISIYGNIYCCEDNNSSVLGYFNAVDIKKKRIFINRNEHNVPTLNKYEKCPYLGEPTLYPFVDGIWARSPFCADCRYVGSNIKPDFW